MCALSYCPQPMTNDPSGDAYGTSTTVSAAMPVRALRQLLMGVSPKTALTHQ
ncbi:hypothetical protein IQ243_11065 [Nostocales cyanobacterium LEGE 11386]|nr:hypothetical protein [Nostocales cyanobacterium LEGE 11386]